MPLYVMVVSLQLKFPLYIFLISNQLKDSSGMATALNNCGIVYEVKEELDLALKQYTRALSLYQAINDRVGLSYCYENLGGIYLLKENYQILAQQLSVMSR